MRHLWISLTEKNPKTNGQKITYFKTSFRQSYRVASSGLRENTVVCNCLNQQDKVQPTYEIPEGNTIYNWFSSNAVDMGAAVQWKFDKLEVSCSCVTHKAG